MSETLLSRTFSEYYRHVNYMYYMYYMYYMSDEANQMSQTPYSIRFQKPMRERLDRLVAVTKRPMSFFVTEALERGRSIETLEAIYLEEATREQARARELEGEMNRGLRQMSLAV